MLECVSVPSLMCMVFGGSWRFFSDSWKFVYRFCDVCGASGTKNKCKERCQGSMKIIRNWAWKAPQIIKKWDLVAFRGGLGNRSVSGTVPGGVHHLSFGTLLAPLGGFRAPFWRPLDFEGVPKSIIFVQDQHKSSKNGHQERCQKKHEIMMENWCENEVPWDVTKSFRIIIFCNLRDLACRKIWRKIVFQKASQIDPKQTTWVPFVRHFEI